MDEKQEWKLQNIREILEAIISVNRVVQAHSQTLSVLQEALGIHSFVFCPIRDLQLH